GQIDHSDFATFVDPPFQTSTGFTGSGGGQLTGGAAFSSAGWVAAPGVHDSVTMRYDFNLSPGGKALFITGIAVEIIPEPRSLTLALVGILIVVLVAYQNRVSMQHR